MSLQLPQSSTRRATARRLGLSVAVGSVFLLLAGCSSESRGEFERLAMPEPASAQGVHTLALWQGAWIAALITGAVVWGLIFYVIWRFRRRSDDEIPIQTRYNLPLEIFYTIAPIIMVIVFFSHTVKTQNAVLEEADRPANIIEVVGQQWQWTFNYGIGEPDYAYKDGEGTDDTYAYDRYAYEVGTASYIPTLVLPVDETTRFNLHSPDVIHDFGVPGFLMKMDVIPGRVNHYDIKPTTIGDYLGKCYELCGTYHSRMLFKVKVVSAADYQTYLQDREAAGSVAEAPLLGGANASTQAGLKSEFAATEGN